MDRRKLLGAGAVTLFGGGMVGTALGYGPLGEREPTQPAYLDDARVVYERKHLVLRACSYEVRPGGTITFEITHTGPPDSDTISLGCEMPWAIQEYDNDEWNHAVWTGGRYANMCYTGISPGSTRTETVTLSSEDLADQRYISDVQTQFEPGIYRFVLAKTSPQLAVNFRILPRE